LAKSPSKERSSTAKSSAEEVAGKEPLGSTSELIDKPKIAAPLAAFLAWVFPGAGHFALGKRRRAVLFCVLVLACTWLGVDLDGHLHTEFGAPLKTLGTIACGGLGILYGILRFVLGHQGDVASLGYEYGTTFLMTAGLMNLLLVLDAWDIARGSKE